MKKIKKTLTLLLITTLIFACSKKDDPEIVVNEVSVIPTTDLGRTNTFLGCIEITSRDTKIEVWDHGRIDNDIVSIIANGEIIIDEQTLDGPSNPIEANYDFKSNGYNYITLYAHNLGDISPNTCTIAINGVEFILEANLDANGSIDVIVDGFGVSCN